MHARTHALTDSNNINIEAAFVKNNCLLVFLNDIEDIHRKSWLLWRQGL